MIKQDKENETPRAENERVNLHPNSWTLRHTRTWNATAAAAWKVRNERATRVPTGTAAIQMRAVIEVAASPEVAADSGEAAAVVAKPAIRLVGISSTSNLRVCRELRQAEGSSNQFHHQRIF